MKLALAIAALLAASAASADVLVIDQGATRTTLQGEMTGLELAGSVGYGQFLADSSADSPAPGPSFGSVRTAPTGAWSLSVQTDDATRIYPSCRLASLAIMGGESSWRFVCSP